MRSTFFPGLPCAFLRTLVLLFGLCLLAGQSTALAAELGKDEIKSIVRQLLRDEPHLILNALEANSEAVLEIAQKGNRQRKERLLVQQWQTDAKEPKKITLEGRDIRGSAKAPVTIVAFSDFTCSYCQQSELLLTLLLETRKADINLVFKPLPKEENALSLAAAKYSLAAFLQDTDKGWKFHDSLFARMEEMEARGDAFIRELASSLGLDVKKLQADAAGKRIETILAEDRAEADRLGISGTPHFLVNDLVIRGAVPKEIFEQAIDMALGLAKKK